MKNYVEEDYTHFRNAFDFNAPGRINLFLIPCPSSSIRWDKRFGYLIDPGRSSIYTIYNHGYKSVDAMLPNMLKLLRLWGYAPPFMVEGLAGYFEFLPYEMKKIIKEGKIPAIKGLLTTEGYYSADPVAAEVAAGSFVRFLADTYGITLLKRLYDESDDLTLAINMQKTYSAPLDSLEKYWLRYVDTLTITRAHFDYYAARAGAIDRMDQSIEYLKEMSKLDQKASDSVDTWKKLSQIYYQYGHYYEAVDGYRTLILLDSSRAIYYQILGNLYTINGEYDKAWSALDTVILKDSAYVTARLLQARILAIKGDTVGAVKLAEKACEKEKSAPGRIEFFLFLGKMTGAKGKAHDAAASKQHFEDALALSQQMMGQVPDDPTYKIRVGLAYLGLKEYSEADKYLNVALFIEERSFYTGEILVALGNLNDLRGKHKTAVEYYQQGLKLQLAVNQHDLCKKYIDTPYSN